MDTRSSKSMVTFSNAFTLAGYPETLPAGDYEILIDEQLIEGLSFLAYRRTATYLTVVGKGARAGRIEMLTIIEQDLELALYRDRNPITPSLDSDAALPPLEDAK